jgi:hypothetical protein
MATNQWGEEVDQWGNPVSSPYDQQYPNYYEDQPPYVPPAGSQTLPVDPNNPTGPLTPNPTPAPAPSGASEPQFTGDVRAYVQALLGSGPSSPQKLLEIRSKLQAIGGDVQVASDGTARGRILLPDGSEVTLLGDGQTWGSPWTWRTGNTGGGGEAGPSAVAPSINPEYLEPFTEGSPDRPTYPTYSPTAFNAPTGDALLANPGYLFRRDQGKAALENNAAARGVLNTGGTLKDFASFGDSLASQEYDNAWQREYSAWNSTEGNNLNAFRANKDVTDTSYNNAWNDYLERRNTFYANQSNPWSKQLDAARVGAGL